MKIAILHYQPRGEAPDAVVPQVEEALREIGHQVSALGVDDRVTDMLTQIEQSGCDLVFNLCETFADDYRMEVNVAALMEMARIRCTGSGTTGLLLAQDKILTKQLLEYHEVLTPKFATFDGDAFETYGELTFPLIVKPAKSDASIGIGKKSIVRDWEGLTKRVREIHREFADAALAEEFIHGRELYVCVLGEPRRPEILPIVELDFGAHKDGEIQIANRDVKFGPETKDSPKLVIAQNLSDELRGRIHRSALLAYRALKLRDYARIDLRISARTNEPYILEVNPNPYLEKQSEIAMAAKERGLSFPGLIDRIVQSAASRYGLAPRRPSRSAAPEVQGPPIPPGNS